MYFIGCHTRLKSSNNFVTELNSNFRAWNVSTKLPPINSSHQIMESTEACEEKSNVSETLPPKNSLTSLNSSVTPQTDIVPSLLSVTLKTKGVFHCFCYIICTCMACLCRIRNSSKIFCRYYETHLKTWIHRSFLLIVTSTIQVRFVLCHHKQCMVMFRDAGDMGHEGGVALFALWKGSHGGGGALFIK